MTSVAAPEEAAAPARTALDRLYAALPVVTAFVWLCLVYAWESWGHVTPWLFTDELELTQLSRGIAETGEAARRGEPHYFNTLYAYLLAPAWWIDSVSTAYGVVKHVGVFVMTSVVFPTYLLGRTIVSKRWALAAGVLAGSIPALAYSQMILEEALAYPYAALCFFLMVKALAERTRGWIVAAVVAVAVAPLVREQLAVLIPVLALAAAGLWLTGPAGRRWRSRWTRWDLAGAVVLAIGAIVFFSGAMGKLSQSWLISTGYYRGRMIEYGLWAAGALTIGLGILPVVAALAGIWRPRGEERTPALRAFLAVLVAAAVSFGLYTAVKAAYISTVFATRIEERNLIYVAPLVFVGTGLFLERPRLRLLPLACAVGLAAYLIVSTPFALENVPYSDAFGLSIVQMSNRNLAFADGTAQWVLLAALAVSVALLLAPRLLRRPAARSVLLGATAVLVLAWNLAGQISGAVYSNDFSDRLLSNFPRPASWLDQVTKGEPALYLGQKIQDPTGVWLIEFWNRSLEHVWSLDGTAPGPGRVLTPDLAAGDGRLFPDPGVRYVVTEPGVDLDGTVVARRAQWRVYRVNPPLRIAHSQTGVFADGWTGCDRLPCPVAASAYSQYATPGGKAGYLVITVSRAAWRGPDKPGNVVVRVGTLVKGPDKQPAMGRVAEVRRFVIHSGQQRTFVLPTPPPPIRADVRISPTFSPADYPGSSDRRQLGAQVGYSFTLTPPARQRTGS